MSVNHCGADVAVTKKFLNGTDVVAVFKKMSGKKMEKVISAF